MNNDFKNLRKIQYLGLTLSIFGILALIFSNFISLTKQSEGSVLASETDTVTVTAEVAPCEAEIKVVPEKRVNGAINLENENTYEVYGNVLQDFRGTTTKTADNFGLTYLNFCSEFITVNYGEDLDFYITGFSHLTKKFDVDGGFTTTSTFIDTELINGKILAGETSIIFNNYINELDLSTQITTLNSNSLKNDLNRDGVVNELDLSNTIFNLNDEGNCSSQQIINGVEACI